MSNDFLVMCVFWFIVLLVNSRLTIWCYKYNLKRRDTKFLRQIQIDFPEAKKVSFIAVETSDEEAMRSLKEQLRAHG